MSLALQQEEKTTNKIQLKAPENSMELAFIVRQKLDELLEKKDIIMSHNNVKFCVYCRNKNHNFFVCSGLKERNSELKRKGDKSCIICETDHDMSTCECL